jgi:hypothetical protein
MYFKKIYWISLFCIFLSGVLAWGIMELSGVWKWRYTSYNIAHASEGHPNLIYRKYGEFYSLAKSQFFGGIKLGLPTVRLYASNNSISQLMGNLPSSVKNWKKGFLVYPDNKMHEVKLRFRGDNPSNWIFEKKSWRVKTKRKNLIDRVRIWDYHNLVNDFDYVSQYLGYVFHQRMGLPTPKARLVELFINDRSHGVYLEAEKLSENFLRNNSFMPVNLYKGEQIYSEKAVMLGQDLFDNPSLWKKLAVFNQLPESDLSDLKRFLIILKEAETSPVALQELTKIARIEDWSAFSAYQTLTQNWVADNFHNMRLILDPWKGTVTPLHQDILVMFSYATNGKFAIDHCKNALACIYNRYSPFLIEKHRILKKHIDEKLIEKIALQTTSNLPALQTTLERDLSLHIPKRDTNLSPLRDDFQEIYGLIFNRLHKLEKYLRDAIYSKPSAAWQVDGAELKLTVSGFAPVGDVTLNFDNAHLPNNIHWDADGDGKVSALDLKIPTSRYRNKLHLDAIFYANRDGTNADARLTPESKGQILPTTFRLLADTPLSGFTIQANNALTKKYISLPKENWYGSTPGILNRPLVPEEQKNETIFSGEITISETKTFNTPVTIKPGATFRMKPGTSLVFRNHLVVEGTKDKPVQVIPEYPTQLWGVFAIYGEKASNSRISNLHLSRGTGQTIDGVRYVAMFSIHDTNNIHVDNLKLRDNKNFDDTMHVIYSNNIRVKDSSVTGAFADAIDVDMSTISFENIIIKGAGNDAIDLMTSSAVINKVRLLNSKDKGVSVGEGSTALLINSIVSENEIGVETKDGSNTYIVNSDLNNNNIQLNAYKKNWRYGSGGNVIVDKSIFRDADNKLKSEKQSSIQIYDSSLLRLPKILKKHIKVEADLCQESTFARVACRKSFTPSIKKILKKHEILTDSSVRGILQ